MPPANKIGITLGIIAIAQNLIDLNNIKKVILINNKETENELVIPLSVYSF